MPRVVDFISLIFLGFLVGLLTFSGSIAAVLKGSNRPKGHWRQVAIGQANTRFSRSFGFDARLMLE